MHHIAESIVRGKKREKRFAQTVNLCSFVCFDSPISRWITMTRRHARINISAETDSGARVSLVYRCHDTDFNWAAEVRAKERKRLPMTASSADVSHHWRLTISRFYCRISRHDRQNVESMIDALSRSLVHVSLDGSIIEPCVTREWECLRCSQRERLVTEESRMIWLIDFWSRQKHERRDFFLRPWTAMCRRQRCSGHRSIVRRAQGKKLDRMKKFSLPCWWVLAISYG